MRCGTQGCRAAPRQVVALEVMGCREAKMEFPYGRESPLSSRNMWRPALIAALRSERGQPKVPEMSELLMKYFKGTRRHRGEGMGDFILRKADKRAAQCNVHEI